MDVIFTDLDGTLLDRDSYSWKAAGPAIEILQRKGIPWILVTSKTRAEVEVWRQRLGNHHPFIVENGGAAFVPSGYFSHDIAGAERRSEYQILKWGAAYEELVADLRRASQTSRCRIRGFHDMSAADVCEISGLPIELAALAKQREYDEPFVVLEPERADALALAIGQQGRRWTRGGRFWHIVGANDKALAVEALTALFERGSAEVRTIGLGDGLNDTQFLDRVSVPILIRSPHVAELKARVPRGSVTERPGPAGWNDAVLALIG